MKEGTSMNKHQHGFTLVEVIIVLVIFAILLAGLGAKFGGCSTVTSGTIKSQAEGYARNYCRRFKRWSQPVVDCAGVDTDGNQYVSCTVAEAPGRPTEQIECPSNFALENNTSCRVPMLRSVQWPQENGN